MANFTEALVNCIRETDVITWIATVTAVIYVILALKENIWCWSFGIVSSALWVSVYFNERLWYESLLSIFYVILGVYGWIQWAKEKKNNELTVLALQGEPAEDSKPAVVINRIPSNVLLICVSIAVVAGIIMGYVSNAISENSFAYSDALLTSFSVVATWMIAKKYLENWLFWIVIDACSAALYLIKGPTMYLAAVLFIFYTFMAAGGYFAWKKSLRA
jgi:nicotinamide mononucleotide transporter